TLRREDDAYEKNDTFASARAINFSNNDVINLPDLQLLAGDNDYFKFTLTTPASVDFLLRAPGGITPAADLYASSGTRITSVQGAVSRNLPAGRYILKISAGQSALAGGYSLRLERTSDDVFESNDTLQTATRLRLTGGAAHIKDLRLLAGNDDSYSFTPSAPS